MKNKKQEFIIRSIAVAVLFIVLCAVYTGRLIYLQVSGQDYYTMTRQNEYKTRTVPIKAQRGEIFDRNGKPLVTNEYTYDLQLDCASMPASVEEKNELLLTLVRSAVEYGLGERLITPAELYRIEADYDSENLLFTANPDLDGTVKQKRLLRLLRDMNMKDTGDDDACTLVGTVQGIVHLLYGHSQRQSDLPGFLLIIISPHQNFPARFSQCIHRRDQFFLRFPAHQFFLHPHRCGKNRFFQRKGSLPAQLTETVDCVVKFRNGFI